MAQFQIPVPCLFLYLIYCDYVVSTEHMKAIRLTWLGKRKLSQQNKNNYKTPLLTTESQRLFVFQVTVSLYFQENVCQVPLHKQPQFTSESAASLAYNSDYSTHTAQAAITCPTQQKG